MLPGLNEKGDRAAGFLRLQAVGQSFFTWQTENYPPSLYGSLSERLIRDAIVTKTNDVDTNMYSRAVCH